MSLMDPLTACWRGSNPAAVSPCLSPVATALVEMASDETPPPGSSSHLSKRTRPDGPPHPACQQRLFQAAVPSPRCAGSRAVGFDRLRIMALSVSLRDTFPMGEVGALDFRKFWKISLYRAMLAKAVARGAEGNHPEEAFTAALILEIGLLVLYDLFLKAAPPAADIELEPLEDLARMGAQPSWSGSPPTGEAA